jgi:class 3 adenylate cyclase
MLFSHTTEAVRSRADSGRVQNGGRKLVTILMADICGSLALIAGQDPEDANDLLSAMVALMEEAVRNAGGLVANPPGDGIVAVFGAPISIEDHAIRACRAAIEMRDRMAHSPPRFGTATDTPSAAVPVSLRIGLHSGEVVLHGTGLAVELASGPVLHVASRLENSATPGTIRTLAETVALTGGLVETASWVWPVSVARPQEAWFRRREARGGGEGRRCCARRFGASAFSACPPVPPFTRCSMGW